MEDFINEYQSLMKKDIYISKSIIDDLIYKNNLEIILNNKLINIYSNLNKDIENHNNNFINKKLNEYKNYFDEMFKKIDDKIILDDDQRKIIISDDDNTLVIAGAGSGKTTTMIAKVKYLVDKLNIKPEEILIISFTNKVTEELKQKINNSFNISTPIYTFHKLGLKIIESYSKSKYKIIKDKEIDNIIEDYLLNYAFKNKKILKKIKKHFNKYLNFTNKIFIYKNFDDYYLNYINNLYYKNKECLKKYNEIKIKENLKILKGIDGIIYNNKIDVLIANTLYTNMYSYKYDGCFYLFDDLLDNYNKNEYKITIDSNYYKIIVDFIKFLFKKYKKDKKKIRTDKEIFYKMMLNSKEDTYKEFIILVKVFILKFKSKGFNDFKDLIEKNKNMKSQLEIVEDIYNYYNKYKKITNQIDFEDIINMAYQNLDKIKLNYKYLIIDEYQDISKSRYYLIKKMVNLFNIKLLAVGDDFQSIYSFSGSDVNLFTNFYDLMGYASLKKITKTYRNSQELIDIAGNFVMKNKNQIFKRLISNKHIDKPIEIFYYDDKVLALQNIIDKIISENKDSKILLLGRYKSDILSIIDNNNFKINKDKIIYTKLNICLDFLTIHSSKGLGSDNVILINLNSGKKGFPSEIEDENLIKLLDNNSNLEEERRLFYVALTRTKNKVYLMCPNNNKSSFVSEILN